tara:strand:- start:31 stop:279 length:249 start_codon:yes stop_codon:yes gene_type:complete
MGVVKMTKKDFIRIAAILKNRRAEILINNTKHYPFEMDIVRLIENDLIAYMKEKNSNFNEFTFCTASNPTEKEIKELRSLPL